MTVSRLSSADRLTNITAIAIGGMVIWIPDAYTTRERIAVDSAGRCSLEFRIRIGFRESSKLLSHCLGTAFFQLPPS